MFQNLCLLVYQLTYVHVTFAEGRISRRTHFLKSGDRGSLSELSILAGRRHPTPDIGRQTPVLALHWKITSLHDLLHSQKKWRISDDYCSPTWTSLCPAHFKSASPACLQPPE